MNRLSLPALLLAASCAGARAEAPPAARAHEPSAPVPPSAAPPAVSRWLPTPKPATPDPAQAAPLGPEGAGSVESGVARAAPPLSSLVPKGVIPFGPNMTRPVRLAGREPAYTREAAEAGVEGKLLVACVITTEGKLENCRIIKSLPGLDEEVLSALKTQRYKPVTFKGREVPVFYMFPFDFRLPAGGVKLAPSARPEAGGLILFRPGVAWGRRRRGRAPLEPEHRASFGLVPSPLTRRPGGGGNGRCTPARGVSPRGG